MKIFLFSAALLAFTATGARADVCDDLISSLEGALSQPGQSPEIATQLQELLRIGRGAKASGNLTMCQATIDGQLQSRPPMSPGGGLGGQNGRDCDRTPDTV